MFVMLVLVTLKKVYPPDVAVLRPIGTLTETALPIAARVYSPSKGKPPPVIHMDSNTTLFPQQAGTSSKPTVLKGVDRVVAQEDLAR